MPPLLPVLRADLGLTVVQSGFIATMLNAMGGLTGMFAGVFADRYGHKRFALIGLSLLVAGGLAGAASGSFALLLLSRFAEGAGFIMVTVSGVALIANVTRAQDRPRAMALWTAYMPAGGALAMLAAPVALASIGWRGFWVAVALAAACVLLLVRRVVPVTTFGGQLRASRLAAETLLHPGAIALSLSFFGYAAMWATVMIWLPTFAVDQRGATPATAALLTVGMVAINIPGNLLGSRVMKFGISRSAMIVFGASVQAACCVGMFLDVLPDGWRYALCLAFSAIGGLVPMAVLSGVTVHARTAEHIGTTNGMIMQLSQIGQFSAPLAIVALAAGHGWPASLPLMLALAACTMAGGIAIGRIELSRPAP